MEQGGMSEKERRGEPERLMRRNEQLFVNKF